MKSRTLGSQYSLLTFKLLKLTLTTIVAPPHVLFISSEKIRKLLFRSPTERLIHAFVSSKLDYCNSTLNGLPSYKVEKLQRLQNTAARLTVIAKESAHITSILKQFALAPIKTKELILRFCWSLVKFSMALLQPIQMSCFLTTRLTVYYGQAALTRCLFQRLVMAKDPCQSLHQSFGMTYPLQSNSAPHLTLLN